MHVELWGLHDPITLLGNTSASILVYKKRAKTWVLYLCFKDDFVDAFQIWLSRVENKSKCLLKTLCADGEGEFISIKLKDFCKIRGITLKYATLCMPKENGLAKRGWQMIIILKDSLLLDSGLPLEFWAEAMDTANYFRNRLLTKSQSRELISDKAWTNK